MNKKKIIVMGIGNMLFSDEGIGYHAIKELEKKNYPDNVTLYDAGTLGLLTAPIFENSDVLIIIDSVDAKGDLGQVNVYTKDQVMLDNFPVKMSPHQIGMQETLLISDLRGNCPEDVYFVGMIPASYDTSDELTEIGKKSLPKVIEEVNKLIQQALA